MIIPIKICAVLILALVGSACVQLQVWERGNLSRIEMGWEPDVLEVNLQDQIHLSVEGSSGKSAAAGGGCGCN